MQTFLNWNFKLLRLFATDIRIHWILPVYVLIQVLRWNDAGLAGYGAGLMACLFLSVLLHEFSHTFMARAFGLPAHDIILWPLGGLAVVGAHGTIQQSILVALVGPPTNFLICGLCLGVSALRGEPLGWEVLDPLGGWGNTFLQDVARMNLILGAFNLFTPAYPLDGAQVMTGLLALRLGPQRAIGIATFIGLIMGISFIVFGLWNEQVILAFVGLFILIQSMITRHAAQFGELPFDAGPSFLPAFAAEPEKVRRPGMFARWRMRREMKRRWKEERERRHIRESVDQLLDRVSQVGLGGLTPEERKQLEEASRRLRDLEE